MLVLDMTKHTKRTSRMKRSVEARGPESSKKKARTRQGRIRNSIRTESNLALYVALKRNQL